MVLGCWGDICRNRIQAGWSGLYWLLCKDWQMNIRELTTSPRKFSVHFIHWITCAFHMIKNPFAHEIRPLLLLLLLLLLIIMMMTMVMMMMMMMVIQ